MKVAVIGSDGQLGADVVSAFTSRGDAVIQLTHADIEISCLDSVKSALVESDLDIVVNTAAMHHVEKCEQQPDAAYAVNATGVRNLALATREAGAVLVHVSTDYVFDGMKADPYVEADVPLPLNVYGNSKLAGEQFVRTLNSKHFVLRVSALYGKHPCRAKGGLNFIELMLKLGRERGLVRVVDDEFVSPTPTSDVARQIIKLSESNAFGLYHTTSEGSCSWYEFAKEIFAAADVCARVEVASSSEFPAKVPRPRYSVLENAALKAKGLNVFRPWQAGIVEYLCSTEAIAIN